MREDAAQMEGLKVLRIALAYFKAELMGVLETPGCLQPYRGGEFLAHRLLDVHGSEVATPSLYLSIANLAGTVIDPKSARARPTLEQRTPRCCGCEDYSAPERYRVLLINPAGLAQSAGQPALPPAIPVGTRQRLQTSSDARSPKSMKGCHALVASIGICAC